MKIKRFSLTTKVLIAQAALYLLLFFSFNNKTFFPPIIIYALWLFWELEDWQQAAWLTLIAVFPFNWGLRSFKIEVPIPLVFSRSGFFTPFLHFPLSAGFLISAFLLITLVFKPYKRKIPLKPETFFLFIFLLLGLISVYFSTYPQLAVLDYLSFFQAITIYFFARFFLMDRKILRLTFNSLFVLALFEGLLASLQLVLKGPMGKIIEESLFASPYGRSAAEDVFRFRATGTFTDPNTMAVFWLMMIPLMLSQVVYRYPLIKNKFLLSFGLIFSFLGLISTFSRAAWLVFALVIFGLVAYVYKKGIFSFRYKHLFYTIGGVFLIFFPVLFKRIMSLQYSLWGRYSSGKARVQLVLEAWEIIKNNPLFGVGPGNFLPAMMSNNLTGVARHFPYPVHNLYLLLASEWGLPALFCFLLFLKFSLGKHLKIDFKNKKAGGLKFGVIVGILAYLLAVLLYIGKGVNLWLLFLFLGILEGINYIYKDSASCAE